MALYLDGNDFALFESPNLKEWTRIFDIQIPGASECPDIFELPVDGDAENTKWGENLLSGISGDLFDIRAEIELDNATDFGFTIRGAKIQYNVPNGQLSCFGKSVPLEPTQNKINLQILVDRTSVEVFGNDGRISISSCFLPDLENTSLGIYASGGEAKVMSLDVYELCSAW